MSMQVFPTAPSPTVTHLMNLVALILAPLVSSYLAVESKEDEPRYKQTKRARTELLRFEVRRSSFGREEKKRANHDLGFFLVDSRTRRVEF